MTDTAVTKERLLEELAEAQRELAYWQRQMEQKPDFGLGTGSTGADLWEMAMVRSEQVSERIQAIEEALARLEEDSFGRCERCGGQINPERLEILPETTLCIDCARETAAGGRSNAPARN